MGADAWKVLLAMVHNLSEILLQTLPNFWKVAKGYMDGKYQKKASSRDTQKPKANTAPKRSPSQVKVMTNDIINLYISLLSQFFRLSSATISPIITPGKNADADTGLPSFMPPHANAMTSGNWLLKVIAEINDTLNEVGSLSNLPNDCKSSLKEFINSARWKFTDSICLAWIRGVSSICSSFRLDVSSVLTTTVPHNLFADAKIFFRLEDWTLDPDDFTKTVYLKRVASYQRIVARLAYKAAGGNEERAMNLFVTGSGNALALLRRGGRDEVRLPEARWSISRKLLIDVRCCRF